MGFVYIVVLVYNEKGLDYVLNVLWELILVCFLLTSSDDIVFIVYTLLS